MILLSSQLATSRLSRESPIPVPSPIHSFFHLLIQRRKRREEVGAGGGEASWLMNWAVNWTDRASKSLVQKLVGGNQRGLALA